MTFAKKEKRNILCVQLSRIRIRIHIRIHIRILYSYCIRIRIQAENGRRLRQSAAKRLPSQKETLCTLILFAFAFEFTSGFFFVSGQNSAAICGKWPRTNRGGVFVAS